MKTIAILIALCFTANSIAGLPPTTLKGQSQSAVTTFNFQVPASQATKTSTGTKIETGNGNLLANPSFDHSTVTTGWTCSNTGTATATITADTTTPVPGELQSMKIICAGGASGGTCSCLQNVTTTAGFNTYIGAYVRSEVGVPADSLNLYSLVNGTRTTTMNFTNSGTGSAFWSPQFVNEVSGSTSTGVEIVVTAGASASGTAWIDLAEVSIGSNISTASIITPWQSYTPTFTGFGTVTVQSCRHRQNGTSRDIECRFIAGTTTATEARVSLPSGDTSASDYVTLEAIGHHGSTTANEFGLVLIEPSVTYLTMGKGAAGSAHLTKQNANNIFTAAGTVSLKASVRVANLAGSTQVFASQCGAACESVLSAKVSSAGVVSGENTDWINGSCVVTSTSVFTCTLNTSLLTQEPNCTILTDTGTGGSTPILRAATSSTTVEYATYDTSGGLLAQGVNIICQKQGADYVTSRTIVGSFKDTPKTLGSSGSDIQSVYFGSGATCNTACSAGTCTVCNQVGNKITSITWQATGVYRLNGIDGTKYNCSGANQVTAYNAITHVRTNSTSTYAEIRSGNSAVQDASLASVACIGIP